MKQFVLVVVLLFGVGLLGCTSGDPVETTRIAGGEATATGVVAEETVGPVDTAVPLTLPPTLVVATQTPTPTATAAAADMATPVPPSPTNTPTPVPTPTEIVLPSPTLVTVLLTPIEQVTIGQSVPIDNDLLFVKDEQIKLWEPQSGQLSTLWSSPSYPSISGWRVSRDRQTILFVTRPHTDNEPGFALWLFNVESREISELWSETETYLSGYAVADSGSVGFITSIPTGQEDETIQTVKLFDSEQGQVTTLADCPNSRLMRPGPASFIYTVGCGAMTAAPDGQSWLWYDVEGLWHGGLEQPPRMLWAHEFFEEDWPRVFRPTSDWSPDGRYHLLWGQQGQVGRYYVFDTVMGSMVETPDYVDEVFRWLWLGDGRLVVMRHPVNPGEVGNFVEVWRVEGSELVQDAVLSLPDTGLTSAAGLTELGDGRLAYVHNHNNPSEAETRNIYLITSFDRPPEPWVSLPPLDNSSAGQSLTWLPNEQGVVYHRFSEVRDREFFYIPADGSVLYDLTDVLGMVANEPARLFWLP